MIIIGYEYESADGIPIRKVVICDNKDEYDEMMKRIRHAGYKLIEFDEVYDAFEVL